VREGLGSELSEILGGELGQSLIAILEEYVPTLDAHLRRGLPVLSKRLTDLNDEPLEIRAVLAFSELQTMEEAVSKAHLSLCADVDLRCSNLWADEPDVPELARLHAARRLKEQLILELSYSKYDVLLAGSELCRQASMSWGDAILKQRTNL
jgi:hypothetical protein